MWEKVIAIVLNGMIIVTMVMTFSVASAHHHEDNNRNYGCPIFFASGIECPDLGPIKEQYAISPSVQSCHTTVIGDYFAEGHVPIEAIRKVLAEKPNIKGITLPGMPSGSPVMPGPKKGPFEISALGAAGEWEPFVNL